MTNRIPTLKEFEQMGRLSVEEIHSSYTDYAATKNADIAALTARLEEAERLNRALKLVVSYVRLRLPNPKSHGKENPHADLGFCWAQLRADVCEPDENEGEGILPDNEYDF
jgi:hypothetical protein